MVNGPLDQLDQTWKIRESDNLEGVTKGVKGL